MITAFIEWARLLKNRLRIKWLELFTDRVKRIEVTDSDGKKHDVVVEQQTEKVCAHRRIEQIDHITWKCMDCDDAYFVIVHKLFARRGEVEQHVLDVGRDLQKGGTGVQPAEHDA
jgi:hypothetical protein